MQVHPPAMPSNSRLNTSVLAVIFDWAGTTVDHGSLAPVEAISQVFAERGVQLTHDQIRKDMGLHKRDHIRSILAEEAAQEGWKQSCDRTSTEEDVSALFERMLQVQVEVLQNHSTAIPGVSETVAALRAQGIKIGSTTGYARDMMKPLQASAAEQGYTPDCLVCPEDVGGGRPFPWMIYSVSRQLEAYPLWRCVKVGDTVSDIEECRNFDGGSHPHRQSRWPECKSMGHL